MINKVLDKLTGVKKNGTGYTARCPSHEDSVNSLAITEKDGKVLLHCFAGCSLNNITSSLGIKPSELFEPITPKILETYVYKDEEGNPLYRVVRTEPKSFYQQRYEKLHNQWFSGLNGVRKVPYNLPAVISSSKEIPIYIVEGEKDADALIKLGFIATTNSGGAGKWQPEFSKYFKDRQVIIIPDNDTPGHAHAKQIHESLKNIANSKVIDIEIPDKGDISDWLAAGHKVSELIAKPVVNSEQIILASVMKDNSQVFEVISELSLYDIENLEYRNTLASMIDLSNENKDINEITLAEKTGKPVSWFAKICENVPSFTKLDNYFEIVKKRATSRRLSELAQRILQDSGKVDADDLLTFIDTKLETIRDNASSTEGFQSFLDIATEAHQYIEDLREGKTIAISTGIDSLDKLLRGGGYPGELHTLVALTGKGKSALSKQISQFVASQDISVGIVTAEMTNRAVFFRMLSPESQVPNWQIQPGISSNKLDALEKSLVKVGNLPIWSNQKATNIFQIRAQAKLLKRKHNIKVLVVDYLQLLEIRDERHFSRMSRTEEVAYVSRMLKKIAKELDVWVLALAQFNRSANAKDSEGQRIELEMHHIAESGAIEKDSDVVMILDMDEYVMGQPERNATLTVAKNRESISHIRINLVFNGNYLVFREPAVVRVDNRTEEMKFDRERPQF